MELPISSHCHTQRHAVLSEDALRERPSLLNKSIQTMMEEIIIGSFNSWLCVIPSWITGTFLFSSAFSWVQPRLDIIDGLDECADPEIQCAILQAAAALATRR
jgi:hypothetical protein